MARAKRETNVLKKQVEKLITDITKNTKALLETSDDLISTQLKNEMINAHTTVTNFAKQAKNTKLKTPEVEKLITQMEKLYIKFNAVEPEKLLEQAAEKGVKIFEQANAAEKILALHTQVLVKAVQQATEAQTAMTQAATDPRAKGPAALELVSVAQNNLANVTAAHSAQIKQAQTVLLALKRLLGTIHRDDAVNARINLLTKATETANKELAKITPLNTALEHGKLVLEEAKKEQVQAEKAAALKLAEAAKIAAAKLQSDLVKAEAEAAIEKSAKKIAKIQAQMAPIDKVLDELKKSIVTEAKFEFFPKATEAAKGLMDNLRMARDTLLQDLNTDTPKAMDNFLSASRKAVEAAKPTLQKDLGWGDRLENFFKRLYNACISKVTKNPNRLFTQVDSISVQAVKTAEKELGIDKKAPSDDVAPDNAPKSI